MPVKCEFVTCSVNQPKELKEFLDKTVNGEPFNKFCVDCKSKVSTFAIIWLGIFVCKDCADEHLALENNSQLYVKDIFNENWDDYQLKSIQMAGNQQFFEHLKEYEIQDLPMAQKYSHPAVYWYKKSHKAKLDGVDFNVQMPHKDMNERLDTYKRTASINFTKFENNTDQFIDVLVAK